MKLLSYSSNCKIVMIILSQMKSLNSCFVHAMTLRKYVPDFSAQFLKFCDLLFEFLIALHSKGLKLITIE